MANRLTFCCLFGSDSSVGDEGLEDSWLGSLTTHCISCKARAVTICMDSSEFNLHTHSSQCRHHTLYQLKGQGCHHLYGLFRVQPAHTHQSMQTPHTVSAVRPGLSPSVWTLQSSTCTHTSVNADTTHCISCKARAVTICLDSV